VGVEHLQYALELLAFDERGGDLVDLALPFVFVRFQLPQHLPFRHISLHQRDVLVLLSCLLPGDRFSFVAVAVELPVELFQLVILLL
jgi:hypothetical protein